MQKKNSQERKQEKPVTSPGFGKLAMRPIFGSDPVIAERKKELLRHLKIS